MFKKAGLIVAGAAIGLVLTGLLLEQEKRKAGGHSADRKKKKYGGRSEKRNGLFAEIIGNSVRMYEVRDGHFCGYSGTKVFESNEKAMEWVVKETDAKIIIRGDDA